jgi:type I restriction-modification system DNA methylase subunit
MSLFRKKIIEKHLKVQAIPEAHLRQLQHWQQLIQQGNLSAQSEIELQGDFAQALIINLLGYTPLSQSENYSIAREYPIGRGKVDLALGKFTADKTNDEILAVFELKGAKTKNLDAIMSGRHISPVQQAWSYARDVRGCQWVLVSNYLEIRLYAVGETSLVYEHFDLAKLTDEAEYARFILCLHADNLLTGQTKLLLEESHQADKDITTQLYNDYRNLRDELLSELIENNDKYAPCDLIAPAQKLLDRILFIAFAEDHALLPTNSIAQAYAHEDLYNTRPKYENFKGLFAAVNKGREKLNIPAYNGGLFATDKLLDKLLVSDEICNKFHQLAKYDFNSEVPVTVLGHIFEQSIADLEEIHIKIAAGEPFSQAAKMGAVSGKRKQHGIVYTPDHITAFIVEHTLGDYLQLRFQECLKSFGKLNDKSQFEWNEVKKTKTKQESPELAFWQTWQDFLSKKLKIVDPACGSGAFLIAAFDFLASEYKRVHDKISELSNTELLFDFDKQILQNNLNGVDINPESIEITKLSLWLKTAKRNKKLTTIEQQFQVGNSLGLVEPAPNSDFCWKTQFAKIMDAGGFDVVLGNPPYVRQELFGDLKPYLQQHYAVYHGVADLYAYFFELGLKLLKPEGMLGFISSATFFKTGSGQGLREFLQQSACLKKVVDFGDLQVFEGVTTYPAILIFQNVPPVSDSVIKSLVLKDELPAKLSDAFAALHGEMQHSQLTAECWQLENARLNRLRLKLTQGFPTLKEVYGSPLYGIKTGLNEAFVIDRATKDKLIKQDPKSADLLKPFLEGKDLKKWHAQSRDLWIIFIPWHFPLHKDSSITGVSEKAEQEFAKQYPAVYQHLTQFKNALSARNKAETGIRYEWYALQRHAATYYEEFEKVKVQYAHFSHGPLFHLNSSNHYSNDKSYIISSNDNFLLGLLNSKIMWLLITSLCPFVRGGYYELRAQYVETLPIPPATDEQKTRIGDLAKSCQQISEQRYVLEQQLQRRFADFGIKKLNQKLERWWLLDFQAFQTELKKSYKVEIALKERGKWEDYFNHNCEKHAKFNQDIARLENELNAAVYQLFGLSVEEVGLVGG